MAAGFTIAEVRFRGPDAEDAVLQLSPGLCVVAGPSNTGKSLLRAAINFVFGARDPMKAVAEAEPYTTILVEIRTADGAPVTFERAWNGGDIKRYDAKVGEIGSGTPATVLAARHSANSDDNISAVLLSLAGFSGRKLRKNKSGELRNLSFRDFVEYTLVSEERIITELSPIHTGNHPDKTFESSLFRALLTGQDDSAIIATPPKTDEKARIAGQEEALERIKADILARIPEDGRTEEDLLSMAATIDNRIAEQSRLLQNYRTDLSALERQRRELEQEHQRSLARLTQLDGNLKRFDLLNQQYESDLQRLQSTVEAGNLLGDHQEGACPICGADPQHHKQHGITPEQLGSFTTACQAEADKIQKRRSDLAGTITQLQIERTEIETTITDLRERRTANAQSFKDILGPSIADTNGDIADLSEQRADIAARLALYEQLRHLDQMERPATATLPRETPAKAFAPLPPRDYDEFATAVQELLQAWSFPELDRVVYDTAAEDIAISGKARKDNGKGYRALTYAAFMVALLKETTRKNLPHPGFIVLDSPLVTYREPIQEQMAEGVKEAFYRDLAATTAPGQIIVLENVEPPDDLKPTITFEGFTKRRTVGRYGLFPALDEAHQPESAPDTPDDAATPEDRQ